MVKRVLLRRNLQRKNRLRKLNLFFYNFFCYNENAKKTEGSGDFMEQGQPMYNLLFSKIIISGGFLWKKELEN